MKRKRGKKKTKLSTNPAAIRERKWLEKIEKRNDPRWNNLLLEVADLCDATGTIIPNLKEMSITALQVYRDVLVEKFKRQEQNYGCK